MAIDTADKLASMLNFSDDGCLLPLPDGSFEGNDLLHLLALYAVDFWIFIPSTEGIGGHQIHVKNVTGLANPIKIKARDGVTIPAQTIERLDHATITSADGGLMLMADGISNWEIVARVGT